MPRHPEITLTVTEDHFKRAVPGDQCHCTIGEAVADALVDIIPALELESVDANTITINPADANGAPCVGVNFKAVREGNPTNVRFLLESAAAFKVAYTTDNRSTSQMRRRASENPYQLKVSELKLRKERTGMVLAGRSKFTPQGHIKALASYAVRSADSKDEAMNRVAEKLEAKRSSKTLPYTLTAKLRKFAETAVADSWEAKGSLTPRSAPIKVHRNKRFYA